MCYTDCFLVYFTIQAGAAIVSTILLALGVLGLLTIPFLPYSSNAAPFLLVMAYMALLVIAFTLSLCGTLTDSEWMFSLGLFLGMLSFLFWAMLTVPSLALSAKDFSSFYCLGNSCGESHWLVPRHWQKSQKHRDDPSELISEVFPEQIDRRPKSASNYDTVRRTSSHVTVTKTSKISHKRTNNRSKIKDHQRNEKTKVSRERKKLSGVTTPSKEDEELSEIAEAIINGNSSITDKLNHLILENEINFSEEDDWAFQIGKHGVSKRDVFKRRPVHLVLGNALLLLDKWFSIGLALVYALLFCCFLVILCMNFVSFRKISREEPKCVPNDIEGREGDRLRRFDALDCYLRKKTDSHSSLKSSCYSRSKSDCRSKLKSDCQSKFKPNFSTKFKSKYGLSVKSDCKPGSESDYQSKIKLECQSKFKSDYNTRYKLDYDSSLKSELDSDCNLNFHMNRNPKSTLAHHSRLESNHHPRLKSHYNHMYKN